MAPFFLWLITSLANGGYVIGSVGLFVCMSVFKQLYSISYTSISKTFYGRIRSVTIKNLLTFGGDLGLG